MTVACIWLSAAAWSPAMASAALAIVAVVFQVIGVAVGSARLFVAGSLLWLPILLVQYLR
jgi:hypothetical protein